MVDPELYVGNIPPTRDQQIKGYEVPKLVRSFVVNYILEKRSKWSPMGLERKRAMIEYMIVTEMAEMNLNPELIDDIETYWAQKNPKPLG